MVWVWGWHKKFYQPNELISCKLFVLWNMIRFVCYFSNWFSTWKPISNEYEMIFDKKKNCTELNKQTKLIRMGIVAFYRMSSVTIQLYSTNSNKIFVIYAVTGRYIARFWHNHVMDLFQRHLGYLIEMFCEYSNTIWKQSNENEINSAIHSLFFWGGQPADA